MSEVWKWSAEQTARHVATGFVSAREVAEATLSRISAVEPGLNALSEVTEDIALKAADAVDAARASGAALGPLAGVPITTKNNVDQTGTLNTGGIAATKDNRCDQDSPVVTGLKQAGAVTVGRTNVPAFSLRWFTDTNLHGRTYNPFDRTLSPGGSSGGAGAALAVGVGSLAHGNDIGGSIRQPAHVNGIVGLRPTMGRVASYVPSNGGQRALTAQMIATDGPMARKVADLAAGLNAMASVGGRDPNHVPMPAVTLGSVPARVGLARASSLGAPEPQVDAALTRAAAALEAAGATVEDVELPRFEEAYAIWQALVFHSIGHHYLGAIRASGDTALIHNIDTVLDMTPDLTAERLIDLWAERVQIMRAWGDMFERTPVVLMPISYRHALKVDADQGDRASLERLFHDQSPLLATALLGHPGLSVPTGLAEDGAPTGVQLASAWWDEATLLAAGHAIESACPPITPITPAPAG